MSLEQFISQETPSCQEIEQWSELSLQITGYITLKMPPEAFITSVRGIVLRGTEVLVVHNEGGRHILPGGRREENESFTDTLIRELLEETGWMVHEPVPFGFIHFHHLTPRPDNYPYPYPDFIQLVFVAEAGQFQPDAKLAHDYEQESAFFPIETALTMSLPLRDHAFLQTVFISRGL